MPTVEASRHINHDPGQLFSLARDHVERLAEFSDDLQSVTVLEREGLRSVSRWVGLIKEFHRTVEWTEEDEWDEATHVCTFRQREGDFTKYEGVWRFEPAAAGGADVTIVLDYEYNVPLIGSLIQGLLKRKVQETCDDILQALAGLADDALSA
jgi:ribosome-associated toxin RatA of RatAB toxin-antitoxin module